MVHISRIEAQKEVKKAIGKKAFDSVLAYVKTKKPSLWGKFKRSTHLEDSVIVTILKDVNGMGNSALFEATKRWVGNSVRSLAENVKRVRPLLARWGRKQIETGNKTLWKENAEGVEREGPTKHVNLWMDSTDFAVRGTSSKGKKDDYHSYKLNSLGRRYHHFGRKDGGEGSLGRLFSQDTRFQLVRGQQTDSGKGLQRRRDNCRSTFREDLQHDESSQVYHPTESF